MKRIIVNFSEKQEAHQFPEGIRYRIPLSCGLQLSVIQTDFSYGGNRGLYEIAVVDPRTETLVNINDKVDCFENDVVKGFLTEAEVRQHIKIINESLGDTPTKI